MLHMLYDRKTKTSPRVETGVRLVSEHLHQKTLLKDNLCAFTRISDFNDRFTTVRCPTTIILKKAI